MAKGQLKKAKARDNQNIPPYCVRKNKPPLEFESTRRIAKLKAAGLPLSSPMKQDESPIEQDQVPPLDEQSAVFWNAFASLERFGSSLKKPPLELKPVGVSRHQQDDEEQKSIELLPSKKRESKVDMSASSKGEFSYDPPSGAIAKEPEDSGSPLLWTQPNPNAQAVPVKEPETLVQDFQNDEESTASPSQESLAAAHVDVEKILMRRGSSTILPSGVVKSEIVKAPKANVQDVRIFDTPEDPIDRNFEVPIIDPTSPTLEHNE